MRANRIFRGILNDFSIECQSFIREEFPTVPVSPNGISFCNAYVFGWGKEQRFVEGSVQ